MGVRSEQRITVTFPVTVRGFDSGGSPFTVNTETDDISLSGASLKGLTETVTPGMKIEIESKGQKSWYRVQWVGQNGSSRAGRIGIRSLEHGKYIWGVAPKEWQPDTFDPSKPAAFQANPTAAVSDGVGAPWSGQERRQFARHPCQIQVLVTPVGDSAGVSGRITDISLGGCYIEMFSPFAVDTEVRLALQLEDSTPDLSARVRASQTGCGMGVSFTAMSAENFELLRHLAPPAMLPAGNGSAPGKSAAQLSPASARPSVASTIASAYAASEIESDVHSGPDPHSHFESDSLSSAAPLTTSALEAAVRVLFRKGLLTQAELSEELEKLKVTKS
jgi:hypothetical protein